MFWDVRLPRGELSGKCSALRDEAVALLPAAMACEVDSDCESYPCTCTSIGRNGSATRFKEVVEHLAAACNASIDHAWCEAAPACTNHVCSTRSTYTPE
jgi:hypothetical protein